MKYHELSKEWKRIFKSGYPSVHMLNNIGCYLQWREIYKGKSIDMTAFFQYPISIKSTVNQSIESVDLFFYSNRNLSFGLPMTINLSNRYSKESNIDTVEISASLLLSKDNEKPILIDSDYQKCIMSKLYHGNIDPYDSDFVYKLSI